jgi:tetratricopeptide (TPR) repeat protein
VTTPCPTAAELAAFLARRLKEARAREIREHLLECEACYEVVTESAVFGGEEEGPPVALLTRIAPFGHRRRPWLLSLAAVLAVALGTAAIWYTTRAARDPVRAVLSTAASARPSPVRLAGAGYAPVAVAERGQGGAETNWELVAELAKLQQRAKERPTAETLHALGLAQLLLRDEQAAVDTLRRAHRQAASKDLDNDLAAALIALGVRHQSPRSIAEGLEILVAPGASATPVSLFNEALALEALGLREQALGAWQRYLALDSSSGWAAEAREHERRLRDRANVTSSADAQSSERQVLEALLPAWATAVLHGRGASGASELRRAEQVAASYGRHHGDHLLSDVVAAARASDGGNSEARARAYLAYASARQAYRAQDLSACRRLAGVATRRLLGWASSLAALATLTSASCAYLEDDLDGSEQLLQRAADLAASGSPRSLVTGGQIEWLRGLVAHAQGRPLTSLELYGAALASFRLARDDAREARVRGLLADLFEYIGRTDAAWHDATRSLDGVLDPAPRYQALSTLQRLSIDTKLPNVAHLLAVAAIQQATRTAQVNYLADAEMGLAKAQEDAGDRRGAIASFRRSLIIARRIEEPGLARHTLAYGRTELAALLVAEDPLAAEELLSDGPLLPPNGELAITAAMVRAESSRRRGRLKAAENVLRAAIVRSSGERRVFKALADRDLFFSRRKSIHEELVRLLIDQGRNGNALDILEDWRAESVHNAWHEENDPTATPNLAASLQQAVSTTAFDVFLALSDELVIWRANSSGLVLQRQPISMAALDGLIQQAIVELRAGETTNHAARLSRLLFGDGVGQRSRRLVVAPDASLFSVPFAALPDPETGAPMVANHEIEVTPSLRLWLRRVDISPSAPDCVLVIEGSPSGGLLLPELSRLEGLRNESDAVARRYRCVVRVNTAADLRAQVVNQPQVIHYAGHAVSTGRRGAALLLADGNNVAPIETPEIESWNLHGATVVLSACSGADGRPSATSGRDGLARAFLVAGARAVIANLWPVADETAFELASELHLHLSRGEPAGQALGMAQRSLIGRGRPVRAWGGWVLVGAS